MTIRSLSCAFIVIFINGCCKDKNPYMEGCQSITPEELGFFSLDSIKPYFFFKEGSWWVYQNDSTLETDSIVMVSSDVFTIQAEGDKRRYEYESFSTVTHSFTNNYDIKTFNLGSNPDITDWSFFLTWYRARSKPGDFEGPEACFSIPMNKDEKISTNTYYRGRLNSLQIFNKIYFDILVFEIKDDATWPDSNIPTLDMGNSLYYYAKNIGLIAIKNTDIDLRFSDAREITQTYGLKHYEIKQ
jgi:hypothetical protein